MRPSLICCEGCPFTILNIKSAQALDVLGVDWGFAFVICLVEWP
jgi:hypothetical protein